MKQKQTKVCFTLIELRDLFNRVGGNFNKISLPIFSQDVNIFKKDLYIDTRISGHELYLTFKLVFEGKNIHEQKEVVLPLTLLFKLESQQLLDVIINSLKK